MKKRRRRSLEYDLNAHWLILFFQAIIEFSKRIEHVTENLEKEKNERLNGMRRKLSKERQRRKKELHEKHVREAKEAGLDPTDVISDLLQDDEDQVHKDLLLLAKQQEKLIRELRSAWEQEEDTGSPGEKSARLNAEMEAKIRAINALRPVSDD